MSVGNAAAPSPAGVQNLVLLGASGSIGDSTLDVIRRHPDRYRVFAVTANRSVAALLQQCEEFQPRYAVMSDVAAGAELERQMADVAPETEVLVGAAALCDVAAHADVHTVMAAIVGAAGMPAALAAARAGKRLLLANKEALVTAGSLFMRAAEEGGATLLPVDSEHNAIFQCLPMDPQGRIDRAAVEASVSKLLLTASGGPFRGRSHEQLAAVTPAEACAHPNWDMGRKISVDSATLMNKGLELAEACWLFAMAPAQVDVVVHPQSIIHSAVQYRDGSVLAQLGRPDMRTPIACCLAWPERIDAGVANLDLMDIGRLDFEAPDEQAFPCLRIARECIEAGGSAMAVCNAANEIAVAAFLDERIAFTDIPATIAATLERAELVEPESLEHVEVQDREARAIAQACVEDCSRPVIAGGDLSNDKPTATIATTAHEKMNTGTDKTMETLG